MATNVKCVVVGSAAVGKTCLAISYANNTFPDDYVPTVFDNYSCNVMYDIGGESKHVALGLWDTDGRKDADNKLRPLNYSETDVFLIVFSLVDSTSLEDVSTFWHPEVTEHASGVPIVLVGTKLDLRKDKSYIDELKESNKSPVTAEDAEKVRKSLNLASYFECSAKTQEGLKEVFQGAVGEVLEPKVVQKEVGVKKEGGDSGGCCDIL